MNKKLIYLVERTVRLHWALISGALMLVSAGLILYIGILPLRSELQVLRGNASNAVASPPVISKMEENFSALHEAFPDSAQIPVFLERMFDIAYEHDISPDKAEFRIERISMKNVSRFHVTLPISGEYMAIRRFINQLMRENMNLALDELRLSRDDLGNNEVNAIVGMSYYAKRDVK